MPKLGEILRAMRDSKGLTQKEVAEKLDLDDETISRLELMTSPPKRGNTLRRVVELYGGDFEAVIKATKGAAAERLPGAHKIRIISKGSAGTGAREYDVDLMNEEHVPGAIYPYPTRDPVAFRVDGPSMAWNGRESLEDGDIVIFCNEHEEPIPDNSLVVAHLLDDDAQYVKRVRYVDADRLELLSQNPRFDPIPVRRDRVRLRRVKVIISRLYLGHQDG